MRNKDIVLDNRKSHIQTDVHHRKNFKQGF